MFAWAYLNNDFVPEEKAVLHVRDLSISRGYSVFDFFRFHNFKPLFLNEHLDRLYQSAAGLGLPIHTSREELQEIINLLLQRNGIAQGGVRIAVTGGISENGFLPGKPSLFISQHEFDEITQEQFNYGIDLATYEYQRQLPLLKTTDYIMSIYLQPWIKGQGADDVLYTNNDFVSECPRSNIFVLNYSDQLCTPARGVLHGVTRKNLIQLANTQMEIVEKDINTEELYEAKEIFITSTTKKILPVRSVNGRPVGTGKFPVSSRLLQLYNSLLSVPAL